MLKDVKASEDLSEKEFETRKKQMGIDRKQLNCVIENISSFHAASMLYLKRVIFVVYYTKFAKLSQTRIFISIQYNPTYFIMEYLALDIITNGAIRCTKLFMRKDYLR